MNTLFLFHLNHSVHRLNSIQIHNKGIPLNKEKEVHPHRTHKEIEIDPITIIMPLVVPIISITIV